MNVIVVENIHGDRVRINVDNIVSYSSIGDYTVFEITNGKTIESTVSIDVIDEFMRGIG